MSRKAERAIRKGTAIKGFCTPAYSGLSLPNVVNSVLEGFGAKNAAPLSRDFFDPGILKGAETVVLACADGLGYNRLGRARNLRKMEGFPITSTAPSTTATALSTLASGLTPQEHGILGFRVFLRELGQVTNILRFGPSMGIGSFADDGIDPEIFFPFRTIAQRMKGVRTFILNMAAYSGLPLSQMLYRGGQNLGFKGMNDMLQKVRKIQEKPGKKFIYIYWDPIDVASHVYGPDSGEALGEIRQMDSKISALADSLKKDSVFLFTADHGQIWPGKRIQLERHWDLIQHLEIPPSGDNRLTFLHCRKGREGKVEEYVERHFSRQAALFRSRELLSKGLFGTGRPFPETTHRIGDFVMVAKKSYELSFPYMDSGRMKGIHGGLSREEMLVPFIWKRV